MASIGVLLAEQAIEGDDTESFSDEPLVLEGMVLDGEENPIADAVVSITGRGSYTYGYFQTVVTDSSGVFAVEELLGGRYEIHAGGGNWTGALDYILSADSEPAILRTYQASSLRVRVVDAVTQDPVPEAWVAAAGEHHRTDENGQYTYHGVVGGTYQLSVTIPGYAPQSRSVRTPAGWARGC